VSTSALLELVALHSELDTGDFSIIIG